MPALPPNVWRLGRIGGGRDMRPVWDTFWVVMPAASSGVIFVAVGVFAVCTAAALAVLPLRGGYGQHVGAGPGAVTVWQIRDAVMAERRRRAAERAHAHAGRHRLRALTIDVALPPWPRIGIAPSALTHAPQRGRRALRKLLRRRRRGPGT